MTTYSFKVKTEERLIALQGFMRDNMPTARFLGEPYRYRPSEPYDVRVTFEIEDMNKLHILTNEWHEIDSTPPPVRKPLLARWLGV